MKDHADLAADFHGVDVIAVEVLSLQEQFAGDVTARHKIVHAVEGAQERGFSAARGTDDGGDLLAFDLQVDIADRHESAVKNGEGVGFDCVIIFHISLPQIEGDYHLLCTRLRSRIAVAFRVSNRTSRTTMAPAAMAWNSDWARVVH